MSGTQPVKRGKKAAAAMNSGARMDDSDELSKEETQIARFLRFNAPKKQGNLLGIKVDFFVASKLIDFLLESKWGPKNNAAPVLANRQACVALMERFMNKQLFYRAMKIYKDSTSDDNKDKSGEADATPSQKKSSKKSVKSSTPTATPKASETTPSSTSTSEQKTEQQQQKRKFKLEMHEDQKFIDGNEPYVWVYDPTTTKTYIIGSLLILGAIGICLFPLWPSQVREGVYYLSLAGASFLGAILGLAVLKYVVFGVVWACTFGTVHFWLLPNLTEDVGFFESFVPVYKCSMSSSKKSTAVEAAEKKKNDDLTAAEDKPASNEAETPSTSKKMQQSSVLSGSTVEITSADVQGTPTTEKSGAVRRRKSSNIREEEDGFELVDDDGNDDSNKS